MSDAMSGKQTSSVFKLRTFCLITGASRGLGMFMAKRFATKFPKGSVMLLVARNAEALLTLKADISQLHPDIDVLTWAADLATVDEKTLDDHFSTLLKDLSRPIDSFEQALLVHNAASLGDVSKLFTMQNDSKELDMYWRLNLTSPTLLNYVFLKHFSRKSTKARVVINVSSICALQPFKSWSLYCAGKAARDMLFATMALEDETIRVLNYAPGPIDTYMQHEARTHTADPELKTLFRDMKTEGRLLTCDQSLDRLVEILDKNDFSSGSHIDYYDTND